MRTDSQLIEALGIASVDAVKDVLSRRRVFAGVHMGAQNLPIGALINLLAEEPALTVPRSGHLGNWDDIACGRAGAMDFNQAICARGLGYPLIHGFTQTETSDGINGDRVYLPGSIVNNRRQHELPVFTWDGSAFTRRSRDLPWFCAFVQTELDGTAIPLVQLQMQRMQTIPDFDFRLMAEVVESQAPFVAEMLTVLLEEASASSNPRSVFQDIISHSVALDGAIQRCTLRRDGEGYWLDNCYYPNTTALVDRAIGLYRSMTHPSEFLDDIGGQMPLQPMISNVLNVLLYAYLYTHKKGPGSVAPEGNSSINVHLHWGARDMAGFPPRKMGYFASELKKQSYRRLSKWIGARMTGVAPVCFALLPASIFMLCPTNAHPADAEILGELFEEISKLPENSGRARPLGIEEATLAWRERHKLELSPYFLNRFVPKAGVLHRSELPEYSRPVEPEGFRELTLLQASAIVGALSVQDPD